MRSTRTTTSSDTTSVLSGKEQDMYLRSVDINSSRLESFVITTEVYH